MPDVKAVSFFFLFLSSSLFLFRFQNFNLLDFASFSELPGTSPSLTPVSGRDGLANDVSEKPSPNKGTDDVLEPGSFSSCLTILFCSDDMVNDRSCISVLQCVSGRIVST